jgi:hypothetical protein
MIALPEDVLISIFSIWLNAKSFLRFDSAFCCAERTTYLNLICNENFVLHKFNKSMINWLLVRSVKLKDLVLVVKFPLSSKKLLSSVRSLKFEISSVNLLQIFPFFCNVVDVINSCCHLTKLNLYSLDGFNRFFLAGTDISVLGKLQDLTPSNGCGEEEIIFFSNTCHNLTSLDLSLSAKSCSAYAVCELLKLNLFLRYLHLKFDGLDSCIVQLLIESCINLECVRLHCEESVYSLDSWFYRHCVSSTKIKFCTLNTVINGEDVLLFSYNVKKKCGGAFCRGITIHYREKALKEQMAALLDLLSNFDSVDLRNVVFTEETIKLLLLRNSHLSCLYLLVEYVNFDLKSMLVTFSQYESLHTVVCKSPQGSTLLSLSSFSEQSLDVRTGLDIDDCDYFEDDIIFENVMPFRSIHMNGDMITDEDVLFETLSLLRGFHRIVLRHFSSSLLNHLELLRCNNPDLLTLEMHVECIENTVVFILDLFSFLKIESLKVFKLSTDEKVYLNYINESRCSVRGSMKEVIPHTTENVFRQIALLIDPVKDIDNQSFCLTNFDAISMIYCQGMDDNLLMRILLSNPNLSCLECSCRHITESMLYDLTHNYPLIRTLILHDCILEAIGLASLMCDCTHIKNFVMFGVHWETSNDYKTLRTVNSDLKYIRFPKKKEIVQWFDETSHNDFVQRCFDM